MNLNSYCKALEDLRNLRSHKLKEVGDQWRTPDAIWWGINARFGPFSLELFADDHNESAGQGVKNLYLSGGMR